MDSRDRTGGCGADGDDHGAARPPQSGARSDRWCGGEALAARRAIDAALAASRDRLVAVTAGGCADILSTTSDPDASRRVPWIHTLAGNAAAVASGIAAALAAQRRSDARVVAQGRDTNGTAVGCLSGLFQRGDDVLYLCYANEPCDLTDAAGCSISAPLIAMAQRARYVATASICDTRDIEAKVAAAVAIRGARYIHIHAPCRRDAGPGPDAAIELARCAVQTGLFPLFEAEFGDIVHRTKLGRRAAVLEYLRLDKRFDALPQRADDPHVERIQAIADRNIARFALYDGSVEDAG